MIKLLTIIWIPLSMGCAGEMKQNLAVEAIQYESKIEKDNRTLEQILNDSLQNVVDVSAFLDSVTHQENVKLISVLNKEWLNKNDGYYYIDSVYRLRFEPGASVEDSYVTNPILYDGKHKILFNDYAILRYDDGEFLTENYGFKGIVSLRNCRIIQIGSNRFLYADVEFMCNGMGCGCTINMIYDLKKRIPTFIEHFRFPYSNYFISDFDNDSNPDLLVIAKSKNTKMKGLDSWETGFKVLWYEYENGSFKPRLDKLQNPMYFYFYGITSDLYYSPLKYALEDKNWL